MKNYKIILSILLAGALLSACKDDYDPAMGTPGKLENIRFTPLAGAGYFKYSIPGDPALVYVKAVYQLDNGRTIVKSSSKYVDSLYVDGFLEQKPYRVDLYTVNGKDEQVLSYSEQVTPFASPINDVAASVTVNSGVASVYLDCENPSAQKTIVYLNLTDGNETITKAYVSDKPASRFVVTPLVNKPYTASVYTADLYGNRTDLRELGSVEPKLDEILSKKRWKLLEDEFVPDELIEANNPYYKKNAAKSYWDGKIEYLWDDVIDRGSTISYFNAGCNPPFSYYIDLGRSVQISRATTWPRRFGVAPWGEWQISEYELYGSNTTDDNGVATDWFFIRRCNIVKPDNEIAAQKEVEEGTTFYLYPDTYGFSPPIRYLRMRVIRMFGGDGQAFCSELTLHGLEKQ